MLQRICVGSACAAMLTGAVFAALAVGGRNVDDAGFATLLGGLILLSTAVMAGLVAWVGLAGHGERRTADVE